MTPMAWCRVGASVVGTSHEEEGGDCQDSAVVIERNGVEGPILVAVVSDGAGSAPRGRDGSRAVVRSLSRSAASYVNGGGLVETLGDETIMGWLDDLRDLIAVRAEVAGLERRDYAATMVATLVSADCAVVIHVGDGACVLGGQDGYGVPSWPAHGEYASTTFFVTDETLNLSITRLNGAFDRVAVFSDGLELLLLQNDTQEAFAPFFDGVFGRLATLPTGRNREESRQLAAFLHSERINQRTNDDKTLLLAYRPALQQ